MESLSRPPHRRKHSTATTASSSSFSLNNPYGDVLLSRGDKAKFQPLEYSEIFAGSSSIPVLDLSGLNGPRPGGCRSSELDYSNIFGGAKDGDVAVCHEQLFNGVVKKKKTRRILADAESPYQEHASLNSSGKAKSSLGANGLPVDGIKQQFNMSFNRTSQRSSNESNGKTHIAQLQAVPGFTHFVDDGAPQPQKKEGERPVLLVKRESSQTWSFSTGPDATILKGGLSSEKSHRSDKSCLPSFVSKDASKETAGKNSPPFFDEELDENSDAAVSIAALRKAIEHAQESMRLAKIIMQKKREGAKDGSRARRSRGRPKVEDKMETRTESGGRKENNGTGKNQRSDPTFHVFTRTDGESAPILSHSDNLLNALKADVEIVRDNFGSANAHGNAFFDVHEKFTPSCSQSGSINTEKRDEIKKFRQNVGESEPHRETTSFSRSVETVAMESGKVDCNNKSICPTAEAVPCLDHMETGHEILEQRESTMHQAERPEAFHRGAGSEEYTSRSVQELEQSPNEEAVEQCQATISPVKGPANHAGQLQRVLVVSGSTQEQEKILHGGGHLRISQENESSEDSGSTADKEKCEMKFMGHEELYLAEQLLVARSDFNNLHNELLSVAEKNMGDETDIGKQPENVSEWKEDGQDAKCSDEGKKGMVPKEEIIWFESELQLEESAEGKIGENEPEIFPVGEASTKVDMVLKEEIDDKKLNFELEEDSPSVPEEHEDNGIGIRCTDAAECEAVETIQIETNSDLEGQNGGIPLDVEELNHTDGAAGRRKRLQEIVQKLNDSASEKDTSEAFAVHPNDCGTIFNDNDGINTTTISSETPEPYCVKEAKKSVAALRGCKENNSLPRETEIFLAVVETEAGKQFELELNKMPGTDSLCGCASAEKNTESQLNNTFKGYSSDSKSTRVDLTNADDEKTLPSDEEMLKTASEIHNTAQEYAANTSMQNFPELHVSIDNQVEKIDNTNVNPDQQNSGNSEESQSTSTVESVDDVSAHKSPACRNDDKDISSNKEEVKGDLDMKSDEIVDTEQQSECLNSEDQSHLSRTNCKPKEMDESVEAERDIKKGRDMEDNVQNLGKTSTSQKQDAKGNEQKCEIDSWQRIEAIRRGREREKDRIAVEREREKDRIAVERAIREARERAFAEARERAERAAVERAAAEAQQRVMGEVREKTLKASVETKSSVYKVSTEAKLRVERAAVERATAEARERALEKAMSQKNSMGARVQAAKYSAERSASSSRNNGLKHSFSYSDLEKSDGATSESAQRRKARLERHQRIMERAAKALAEKNTRDLLAQKEQAERSRLAESLDADIKRWATGKEGNLRALLSTLQYILGPESAWQPVTLTEIVTAAAVKKTYRKATLCVHPDKLQQRGASIRQRYICEKIFDLLKAAWNRFNSEEI